jgi:putative ABC transport system permease protein
VKVSEQGLGEVALKEFGQELTKLAEGDGNSASVVVPPPGEHPHQNIVNGISFLQRSFGSILAALGVILLSLILITWLYPQLPVIGIMKAMGAPGRVIFQSYLSVLLLLLVLGMLGGLPLGYKTARLYSGSVAFIQNFTPVKSALPWYVHVFSILPVLLIPTAVVWIPLRNITRATVQDALSHIFYTPFRKVFLWSQEFLHDVRWKYSMNNLFRSNQRTVLVSVLLISGVALFCTGVNLRRSLKEDFAAYADEAGYGITVVLKDSAQQRYEFIEKLPFVEDAAYISVRSVRFRLPDQSYEERAAIRMFPPGYQLNPSRITAGSLNADCEDCVFVSQRYQNDFEKIPIGSKIQLIFQNDQAKDFIYSGVVKDISHPGFYWPRKIENSSFNEIAIRTSKSMTGEEATRLLDDAFLENDVDVRQLSDIQTRLRALENHLAPMYLVIQVMGVATILIALIGLGIVLSLSIQERTREIGIMKALGGSVSSIIGTYHREYALITSGSIIIGLLVGYFFNAAICNLFGIMVINAPVPPLQDFSRVAVMIGVLLLIQTILIELYVRYKLKRSSSSLLTEIL